MSAPLQPGMVAEADGVFFITIANGDRKSLAYAVERLIAVLDALEPDSDLEDAADAEPSLGWPEHRGVTQLDKNMAHDDREEENEHGGDVCDEPHDAADCGDDEPNLGSRELCSQWKDMQALGLIDMNATDPNDTDGISVMGGVPLDFQGDGNLIGKALVHEAGPRIEPYSQIVGERVTILPDGKEFRTFVPYLSGYAVPTLKPDTQEDDSPDMTDFSAYMPQKKMP